MGFFDRGEENRRAGDGGSGRMPDAAAWRLGAPAGEAGLFTSTLSVNELALLGQLGPEPLAGVMGMSVHQVGWQYLPPEAQWGGDDLFCQLHVVSRAWDDARRSAFGRLAEEAAAAGGDLVLGVHLRRGSHDWARRSVDYVVSGTAVRLPGGSAANAGASPGTGPGAAAAAPGPVLSDLSVQDYWKLAQGGWHPAGLLAATSACFIAQSSWTRWQRRRSFLESQERWEYSDGFSAARHAVVNAIRRQARLLGADGVVGVALDYEVAPGSFPVRGISPAVTQTSTGTMLLGELTPTGSRDRRRGVVVTFHAVGSAIRRAPHPAPTQPALFPPSLSPPSPAGPSPSPQVHPLLNLGAPL